MRFFLTAFAFTLFLVVNTSPTVPPNHSPEVTTCIKSLNNLHDRISTFHSALDDIINSTENITTVIVPSLKYIVNSGDFGYIRKGFDDIVTKCRNVTLASEDERTALTQAYKGVIIVTQENVQQSLNLVRIAIDAGFIQRSPPDFKLALRKLFKIYSAEFELFTLIFSKIIPSNEVPEFKALLVNLEEQFSQLVLTLNYEMLNI